MSFYSSTTSSQAAVNNNNNQQKEQKKKKPYKANAFQQSTTVPTSWQHPTTSYTAPLTNYYLSNTTATMIPAANTTAIPNIYSSTQNPFSIVPQFNNQHTPSQHQQQQHQQHQQQQQQRKQNTNQFHSTSGNVQLTGMGKKFAKAKKKVKIPKKNQQKDNQGVNFNGLEYSNVGMTSASTQDKKRLFSQQLNSTTQSQMNNIKRKRNINSDYDDQVDDSGPMTKKKMAHNPIIGTCTSLEKAYFRLTSAPDPSTVRPEKILKKALKHVKEKYDAKNPNYNSYICEQLKSIRQDLTVQRIRNKFTVKVYEVHARYALENNDLSEFNQCQSQLKDLYNEGIEGHVYEFTAYRILYLAFIGSNMELTKLLQELPDNVKSHEFVKHALSVNSAMAVNNFYSVLTHLYQTAPKMGKSLIKMFTKQMRDKAFKVLIKSHVPTDIPLDFVKHCLGFETETEFFEFLKDRRTILSKTSSLIDCKQTFQELMKLSYNNSGNNT